MPASAEPSSPAHPTLAQIFVAWLWVGLQSWGGGTATGALIRQTVVERHKWLSDADFGRALALCQVAPGMNLFALCIVLGRRLHGMAGGFVALFGLVLPSVTISILVTYFWSKVQFPGLTRVLSEGVVPAVVGVGIWSSLQTGKGLIAEAQTKRGQAQRITLLLAAALVTALYARLPVWAVLLAGGIVGALGAWWNTRFYKRVVSTPEEAL